MHTQALNWIAEQVAQIGQPQHVIEIGSRNINGGVRHLFASAVYVGIDIEPGADVDVVADGREWLPRRCVDAVVCCEVLEHCEAPDQLIRNASQMLLKGGRLLVTCATDGRLPHSGIDGGPVREGEHYRNVPIDDLRASLSECFEDWAAMEFEERGDLYITAVK